MDERPDIDTYYLELARVISLRGTCARRQVGAVLVDANGHVLATGYNGRPRGWLHCRGSGPLVDPCPTARSTSGLNLDGCEAIHAEQNALLQCGDVSRVHTCYSTTAPCITCAKLLLNTGCQRVVYTDSYPHDAEVLRLLARGRVDVMQRVNDAPETPRGPG